MQTARIKDELGQTICLMSNEGFNAECKKKMKKKVLINKFHN
jgi:hypothetical protein